LQTALDTSGVLSSSAAEPKEMLSVSEADGVTNVRINFSSLSVLQECARKSEYLLVRGLKSNLESPALLFGSAIHKGLEVYYSGERTERSIPSYYKDIMQEIGCGLWDEAWGTSLLYRAARAFVLKAAPLSALPDDNKRSILTGVWMLQHYFTKYLADEYVIMRDDRGPVVERRVSMPVFSSPLLNIELFGTIDFVMKSEVSGQILPGDHKTASSLYDFYDKISPNFQYTGYLWACREVLGYDTDLFLVNALQVKRPPKTARGSEPDFARQITQRTQEDYDELKSALIDSVTSFLRNRERNYFPMSATGACTARYGSCTYRDVCAAPAQLRENIISAKFAATGHIA
jgi:hypothetical protein